MSGTITISDGITERECSLKGSGRALWPDNMSGAEMVRALRWLYEASADLEQRIETAVAKGKRAMDPSTEEGSAP